jgi:nicotinamidase-related amidase
MAEGEKAVANTRRLLGLAEVMGLPVIATEQEKLGRTIPEIGEKLAGKVVPKTTFDCFLTDEFSARVAKTERSALIICGIEAHICVAQTALSGHPRFTVHVVADAIASRSPHNVSIAVERMRAAGVTITSTEMVIYELLQRAGTAEFKAMLPLVK